MITWIVGESGSGKSYIAKALQEKYKSIWLDGDVMRRCWFLGFTTSERWEQNMRIAKIARALDEQGHDVVISTICPSEELRKEVQTITRCKFVEVKPYTVPK